MMATAPVIDDPAHVSASSDSQPIQQHSDANHVDPDHIVVNGTAGHDDIENKHISNVEDQLNSADVSVSGGSDTEASRADGLKSKDGDKLHGRTASTVKKPATFKAVSVNKTFLAAKSTASSVSPKPTDKPISSSNTPPPGSATLSVPRPRLVAKTGSGSGSIPRFSNGNGGKPAAAPDPSAVWNKNRAPEPKKLTDEELKKYGIHMASRLNEDDAQGQNKWADIDDDDDDWAPEAITWGDGTKTTLPHPDEHPAPLSDNGSTVSKGKPMEKPQSPVPSGPPTMALQRSGNLAAGKGLVLKSGVQEKPSLVTKPIAPLQAKSPWAALPPIDKASPAALESPLASRGPPVFAAAAPNMTAPPREIAADDFSRSSWREGATQGNRELYNSHSGKYEPVPDRRGSLRPDQHSRHPAVLQRHNQADLPAEPSSAFQTSRTSQDVPYRRRRASSNVSGGSGTYFQRLGRPSDGHMPPPELLGGRRPSHASSGESPVSPVIPQALVQAPNKQQLPSGWQTRQSPESNVATLRRTSQAPVVPPPGQDVAAPPVPAPSQEDTIEFQKKLMREKTELARKRRQEDEKREEAEKRARIQKKLEALGPAPEKKSDKKEVVPKPADPKPTQIQQREQAETPSSTSAPDTQRKDAQAEVGGRQATSNAHDEIPTYKPRSGPVPRRLSHGQESRQADLWAGTGSRPDRFASWASGPSPPLRNVWGSPDNDRGLGNGTFNPDLLRISGSSVPSVQGSKGPTPIAPPGATRTSSQGQPQGPVPIGSRGNPRYPPNTDLANKWVTGVAENDQKMNAARVAERAERERQLAERGLTIDDVQPTIKDTWRPVHLPGDGTRRVLPAVETQTHGSGLWASSREELAKGAQPDEDRVPAGHPGVIGSGPGPALSKGGQRASSQPRPSRFFPAKDFHNDSNSAAEASRPGSPTPPPPTMEGHPAYEGDAMHPHVSLPKPQPVVKLPPAMTAVQPSRSRPDFAWPRNSQIREPPRGPEHTQHVAHSRVGETTQANWQSRINNLLNGGKLSPPKSMGVDPASKSALDHTVQHDSATVSLPASTPTPSTTRNYQGLTSKPMAEECFEEQEMGSLPQIRLPHKVPAAAWTPAQVHSKPLPRKFLVQASIMEPFIFAADFIGNGNATRIQFPGMKEPKIIAVPSTATRGSRGGHGRPGPRHRGSSHTSRGGKRENSGSYESHGSSSSGRGGRGTFKSRSSDNWKQSAPSQPQAQSSVSS